MAEITAKVNGAAVTESELRRALKEIEDQKALLTLRPGVIFRPIGFSKGSLYLVLEKSSKGAHAFSVARFEKGFFKEMTIWHDGLNDYTVLTGEPGVVIYST